MKDSAAVVAEAIRWTAWTLVLAAFIASLVIVLAVAVGEV